jgi:hypothetical protein
VIPIGIGMLGRYDRLCSVLRHISVQGEPFSGVNPQHGTKSALRLNS